VSLKHHVSRLWYTRRVHVAIAVLCAIALTARLLPRSVARDLELQCRVQNAGMAWSIDWPTAHTSDRNGHWIDLQERLGLNFSDKAEHPLTIRARIANTATGDIALRWQDSPGARLIIDDAFIDDTILSLCTRRTMLTISRTDGAQSTTANSFTLTDSGGIHFNCPAPPKLAWAISLAASLCAVVSLGLLLEALWQLAGIHTRWPAHKPRPMRGLSILALLVIFAVPLWMLSWAPMIISGDGIEYMQQAIAILEHHNFSAFDGWRLPGYPALMLPFIATMSDFTQGVGLAHAAMAILVPLMAWDLLRRRLPSPWPQFGAICLALDPALVMWQRTVLTEEQTIFLITLCAWLLVRIADRLRSRPVTGLCIALGLTLAAACYTRPNMQIFAVLAPLAICLMSCHVKRPRWLLPAAACLLTTTASLAPIFIHNTKTFSRTSLVVGSDWNRAVWAFEDGLMDWNQSGVFTFDQFRQLRTGCERGTITSWGFLDLAQRWQTPSAPQDLHPTTQRDIRARALWQESAARRPDGFLAILPRAAASLMGWPTTHPAIFHNDAKFLLSPLLNDPSQCPDGTNWLTGFDHQEQPRFFPIVHFIGDVAQSRPAKAFGLAFKAAAIFRPCISALFIFATVVLVRRRDWPFAALALILLAHMAAVPLLVFCGNDRYAMPWYGLMTVIALAGLLPRPQIPEAKLKP
jgi:hypothetical protein